MAIHAGLGVYLWKARFEPQYREFADEVTDVVIINPAPPPPPPPPPPPADEPPKPPPKARPTPKVQPRPPARLPHVIPVPPLPVPPVVERVEPPPAPPSLKAVPAPAAPPRPAPVFITQPDWLRRPSGADVARYYPDRAQRMGVEGRATISCKVDARGELGGCEVLAESPGDYGFGEAAVGMSRRFKMRPMTRNGEPVAGGAVRIPIRFTLPG